jgi:hypothetical protein
MVAAFVVAGLLGAPLDALAASDSTAPSAADIEGGLRIGRARVQVRVYDTAVMSAAGQTVALRAATGVLAAAGIDVIWLVCGNSDVVANPDACAAPVTRDELAVRLVRLTGTPSARGQLSLGYSLLDISAGGGTLATVFVDRVEWLLAQTGPEGRLPVTALLGFAIAHEVGHLLLGTNVHAPAGLMRAVWSRSELQRNDPADWLFTPADGVAMSRALRQRHVQMAANWAK